MKRVIKSHIERVKWNFNCRQMRKIVSCWVLAEVLSFSFQRKKNRLICKSIFFNVVVRMRERGEKSLIKLNAKTCLKSGLWCWNRLMRFHWQKPNTRCYVHFFIPCEFYVYFRQFSSLPSKIYIFFTRKRRKSESQVWRASLLGTLVDFIWISCTFPLLYNFHFHSHTIQWAWRKRRRKNQITRRNVIKILLFSHCDLFSFTIFYFRSSLSEHVIKKIERISFKTNV
jgi:hypothetical protein